MKILAVTDFKARALQILARVADTREQIILTKRGKPFAEIIPFSVKDASIPGKLSDALVFEKDIVPPLGADMWESCE